MNIALIGSGGREHAICQKLYESSITNNIYCIPGNAGTSKIAINLPLDFLNFDKLLISIKYYQIDLVIIGPELPLVRGLVDFLRKNKIKVFGPNKYASQLEGSKAFMKSLCKKYRIPTAGFKICKNKNDVKKFLIKHDMPIVVKADGLAAGKGVAICNSVEEVEKFSNEIFAGKFKSSKKLVIEEFLNGEEVSYFLIVDKKNFSFLGSAQDHKRVGEDETGPNTGGMGAYSPAPLVDEAMHKRIMDEVIMPTINGMAADGYVYTGFLYAGIMVAADGTPKVLEFNCRFGDPETQPIMMRLKNSIVELCIAGTMGVLDQTIAYWDERPAVGVVLAAKGYPDNYPKGDIISLPEETDRTCKIFHAGTALNEDGMVVTNGGRVLCAVALGDTVGEAQHKAYELADKISWDGVFCRRDIAYRAIARELLH